MPTVIKMTLLQMYNIIIQVYVHVVQDMDE